MENYNQSINYNSININREGNSDWCIKKVADIIRNKKDARWFCQQNRKNYSYNQNYIFLIFLYMIMISFYK